MLDKKMLEALNKQINEELYSAYLYLSMSTDAQAKNFNGFAHWLKVQAKEEINHAMRIYNYIYDKNEKVELMPIQGPQTSWQDLLSMFESALKHEKHITSCFYRLTDLANELRDYTTKTTLIDWFLNEQLEEEASVQEIVDQLNMIKGYTGALFMLDKKLGKREE